jgi:hypothetical protein
MDVIEPFLGRSDHNAGGSKAKPRPKPPAPPGGGEPVAGVADVGPADGPALAAEPDPGPEPVVPAEDDAPAPAPDLPPSRS